MIQFPSGKDWKPLAVFFIRQTCAQTKYIYEETLQEDEEYEKICATEEMKAACQLGGIKLQRRNQRHSPYGDPRRKAGFKGDRYLTVWAELVMHM